MALNREAWELLFPNMGENNLTTGRKVTHVQRNNMLRVAELVAKKRKTLSRAVNQTMEDLIMENNTGKIAEAFSCKPSWNLFSQVYI
jgi:hypothetical protein